MIAVPLTSGQLRVKNIIEMQPLIVCGFNRFTTGRVSGWVIGHSTYQRAGVGSGAKAQAPRMKEAVMDSHSDVGGSAKLNPAVTVLSCVDLFTLGRELRQ